MADDRRIQAAIKAGRSYRSHRRNAGLPALSVETNPSGAIAMFRMSGLIAAALGGTALMLPATAGAQRYHGGRYEQAYGAAYQDGYNRPPQSYRGYDRRGYDQRDRGYAARRCSSGTTGTIVGAIAGGLLGRTIDTRGDRSLGTILGLGGGALAGRAVERSNNPASCR